MGATEAVDIARDAILVALKLGAPVMLLALAIGLVVSLFQALTQIQEMTLTFVPKIVVLFISLLVLFPFMLGTLTTFTERLMDKIIGLG